jgi:hypothetical protein
MSEKSEKYENGLKKSPGYKNIGASESMPIDGLYMTTNPNWTIARPDDITLTELLTNEATEEQYDEVLDILEGMASRAYSQFSFLIAKSQDEVEMPNFLQIESDYAENAGEHKAVFELAMRYGIQHEKLTKLFAERVANGKVIPLGKDVVVITDDGTGNPPTGVSPINRGIEGGQIAFIVTFVKKANFAAWHEKAFPTPIEGEVEANDE